MPPPQPWLQAAEAWLTRWRRRHPVLGAVVAGSYVTGQPGPHSDLDIQVVLEEGCTWRERGKALVDGFLIEYFANPALQIRRQFFDERHSGRLAAVTTFATGRMLADDVDGTVAGLQARAAVHLARPLPRPGRSERAQLRYRVWDLRDGLRAAIAAETTDLVFQFHNALAALQQAYARFLGAHQVQPDQQVAVLSSARTRARYRMPAFPDPVFARRFARAARLVDAARIPHQVEALFGHVLDAMGGMRIDGWRNRVAIDAVHPCLARWPEGYVLTSERLVIRQPSAASARELNRAIHESARELQPWMPWANPLPTLAVTRRTRREAEERFERRDDCMLEARRREDGRLVAMTGFHPRSAATPELEIGYWCRTPDSGRGYVTELVRALSAVAIHHLGCRRVVVRCDRRNERSAAVARRAGFQEEGLARNLLPDGRSEPRDSLVFALIPGDPAVPAADSIAFGPA